MIASLLTLAALWGAPAAQEGAKTDEFARIDKWIQEWQPTAGDRKFEEIGWVKEISEAMKLAKQHGRPVLVFTHKGRINLGRQ